MMIKGRSLHQRLYTNSARRLLGPHRAAIARVRLDRKLALFGCFLVSCHTSAEVLTASFIRSRLQPPNLPSHFIAQIGLNVTTRLGFFWEFCLWPLSFQSSFGTCLLSLMASVQVKKNGIKKLSDQLPPDIFIRTQITAMCQIVAERQGMTLRLELLHYEVRMNISAVLSVRTSHRPLLWHYS